MTQASGNAGTVEGSIKAPVLMMQAGGNAGSGNNTLGQAGPSNAGGNNAQPTANSSVNQINYFNVQPTGNPTVNQANPGNGQQAPPIYADMETNSAVKN
jgi:hypothetical protein